MSGALPRSWGGYLIITALSTLQGTQLSLVAPLLDRDGYAPAAIGALVSATTVASLAARLPAGLLYERLPARRVQGLALGLLAILVAAHPFAGSAAAMLVVRVLTGVAYGVGTTLNLARFVDEQPAGAARARAMGYYATGIAAGYTLASLLVGYAVEIGGYRAAFGVGAVLVALGLLGLLDRTPVLAHRATAAPAAWGSALRAPALLVLLLEALLLNLLWAFWNAWLPLYALAVGLTLAEAGLLRTGFGLANAVGRPLGGGPAARLGVERTAAGALLAQCALLPLLPVVPELGVLLTVFVLSGLLRAVGIVANTVAVVERAERQQLGRGAAVALFSTATDVGLLSGPACGGLLVQLVGPVQVFVAGPLALAGIYGAARLAVRLLPEPPPAPARPPAP
ncbi:MAG: MFS transporter [Chloroflexi bacterium]|nr:MFS transporter [Chloroflexota bacterium]